MKVSAKLDAPTTLTLRKLGYRVPTKSKQMQETVLQEQIENIT
jgi:hypothetical protein